jgi:hypothetical protein
MVFGSVKQNAVLGARVHIDLVTTHLVRELDLVADIRQT